LPQFEVAAVKPNKSGMGKVMIQSLPGGRFSAENVTLRQLIRYAYQLQDSQLSGGPKWLEEERFDIVASGEGGDLGERFLAERTGQPGRAQLMLRALLGDRFKLQAHSETREQSIYLLIAARRDGTPGPQLHPSDIDCSAPGAYAEKQKAYAEKRKTAAGAQAQCGIRILPGSIVAGGAGMIHLANSLVTIVGRMVVDR